MKLKSVPEELISTGRHFHHLIGERVKVGLIKEKNIVILQGIPEPGSKKEFNEYIKRVSHRFEIITKAGEIELINNPDSEPERLSQIQVSITLSKLLSIQEVNNLLKEFEIHAYSLKFTELDYGVTEFCKYPISEERRDFIKIEEADFKKRYPDFKYPDQIGAIYGLVQIEMLRPLLEHGSVYIVDPGPIEFYQEYKKFYKKMVIRPSLDCFYWINKFSPN